MRLPLQRIAVTTAMAAWAAGCSRPPARLPATATANIAGESHVVDGVTTTTHAAHDFDLAPQFTVDTKPAAILGAGNDPRFDLTYGRQVVALASGGYAVMAFIGNRLMIFDSLGHGVRAIGRTGQGPGDFMRPGNLIPVSGDTLYTIDEGDARVDWIVPDKGVVRTAPLELSSHLLGIDAAGILPGNRVVGSYIFEPLWDRDTVGRPRIPLVVSGIQREQARILDSIPSVSMARVMITQHGRPMHLAERVRFGVWPAIAVWDTLIALTRDDLGGNLIELRNAEGHVVGQLRSDRPRRAVTAAMREAQIQEEMKRIIRVGEGGQAPAMTAQEQEAEIRSTPTLDSLPAYQAIFSTRGGVLWVVDAIAPTDSGWTATGYRADGAIVARLQVPGRDRPTLIDDVHAVVRHEDDDGLITYRVYRIRPPS